MAEVDPMWRHGLCWWIVLASCCAQAQLPLGTRDEQPLARNVVSSYCRMDYQGFRLAKDSWERMKGLTAWKENPEWRSFTVVSRYDISPASEALHAADATVHYAVLGRFHLGLGYAPERGSQKVVFHLKESGGEWKIEDLDPFINPHVSKPQAIAWLRSSLATEKDAANKVTLEKALKELEAKQ